VVVEIVERDNVIVHRDVAETVDAILRGHMVPPEARWRNDVGEVQAATKYDYRISETAAGNPAFATLEPFGGFGTYSRGGPRYTQGGQGGLRPLPGRGDGRNDPRGRALRAMPGERLVGERGGEREPAPAADVTSGDLSEGSDQRRHVEAAIRGAREASLDRPVGASRPERSTSRAHRPMSLFAFGVSRKRLEQSVRELGLPVTVARDLDDADAVVTLRNYYRRKPSALRDAESAGVPIYVLKTNTVLQMENMLASLYDLQADPQEAALRETAEAIGLVESSGRPIELSPQNAYVRRLQHQLAERHNLMSRSRGAEPNRRVELLPDEGQAWR